ncbi:hypothetical protein NC653_036522 [Populus alba x Populus x berolinensis]|uniref:Uncharacterized protein n=1 Tax=Populus alba x Populus x berolinensis TaxID=444605 RepID=A0AAD6LK95_9ROSI|nr:hypothetical protein NC653_036522 [Populus alba x Populus x berolinensis]
MSDTQTLVYSNRRQDQHDQNSSNGMISTSSTSANTQSTGIKGLILKPQKDVISFHYEQRHILLVTLAIIKDKPAPSTPTAPPSGFSTGSGVRSDCC